MDIGLLWYDGDPKRPLEDKVGQAVERYREKYGRLPNTCYVHPHAVSDQSTEGICLACKAKSAEAIVRVVPAPNILAHHFWIGEARDGAGASGRKARS